MLGRIPSDDDHLAPFAQIEGIDEASAFHLHFVHLTVFGEDAFQLARRALLSGYDADARLRDLPRGVHDAVGKSVFRQREVAVVETDAAPLHEAVVGDGRDARPDLNDVHGHLAGIVLEGMDEPVARAQQHDEQEDSHRHRKARQCRAQLVVPEVGPDLL